MCRFVMYLGPEITMSSLVTEPSHSLIHQSMKSRERPEPLNGDGFGVTTTAAAHVQRAGQGFPGQLGVFSDEQKRRVEDDLLRASLVCFKIDDFHDPARSVA